MNINSFFAGDFLKAEQLKDGDLSLTISDIEVVEFKKQDGSLDRKPALVFSNSDQKLTLNKTNTSMLAKILGGTETDDWVGKTITLYASVTDFQGNAVDCIRIRPELSTTPTPAGSDLPF